MDEEFLSTTDSKILKYQNMVKREILQIIIKIYLKV